MASDKTPSSGTNPFLLEGPAFGRQAHGARRGGCLRGRQAGLPRRGRLRAGKDRPAIFRENGRGRAAGRHGSGGYGGLGAGYVTYGLIAREVERIDSGYRSMMSVQSVESVSCIRSGLRLGRAAQEYLPKLASGEGIGCFGLTEPDAGSDPGGMKTRAERRERLSAQRLEDVDLQRADRRRVRGVGEGEGRGRKDAIRGFVLEKGMKGAFPPKIEGKLSLRASITGEIVLEGVEWARRRCCPTSPA